MAGWVQNVIGVHAQALSTYSRRAQVLSSNLANADTPGYKARDVDFKSALSAARSGHVPVDANSSVNSGHIKIHSVGRDAQLLYRNPQQPSLDGNTVESPVEQAAYAENAVRYQASLRFIDGAVKSLLLAIKGE